VVAGNDFYRDVIEAPVVDTREQSLVLRFHKEKPCAGRGGRRTQLESPKCIPPWSWSPWWCGARGEVNSVIVGSTGRKECGASLVEILQEVLVLGGNSGKIRGFPQACRRTLQGRLHPLKAMCVAERAPIQDRIYSPVDQGVVPLEP
jgi:hypothetical protein